jgi:hypothetical protein
MINEFERLQQVAGIKHADRVKFAQNRYYSQLTEGINIYLNIMGYKSFLTEAEVKIEKITPEIQAWFQGLESLYSTLNGEEQERFGKILKAIKAGEITKQDIEKAASQEGEITEADEEDPKKGPKLITPLNNFLKSKTGKAAKLALALAVGFSLLAGKIQNSITALTPNETQEIAYNIDPDNTFAKDNTTTLSWEQAKEAGANDGNGNSIQDLEGEENTTTQFVKFKFGQGSAKGLSLEGGESVNDILDGLKVLDNAGEGEVTITAYGEASNTGDGSDVPNDGEGSLANNRASTVKDVLQKKVDKLGLKNIKVNIESDDTPQDHYKTLNKTTKEDGNKGAGVIVKIKTDVKSVETTETPDEFVDDFNPAFKRWGWFTDKEPAAKEKEPKPEDKEQDKGSDLTPPPPPVSTDSEMERDVKAIANLNRNSQIALLLSRTSPSLSLFKELKLDSTRNITDGELNSIADQGTYKGEQTSKKATQLAKIIRTSRKSPNTIIKAYAKLTGAGAKETRARAAIAQKGVTGKSASAPIREGFSNFSQLLLEAAIDTILNNIPSPSTQQAAFLAKLVNMMYVGTEGGDVLDPESSEDKNFKVEYDKIQSPLASKEKGERYVYLDKKQDQTKTQPDIERVDNIISNNTPLMTVIKRINTQDELASLLTAFFIYKDKNGKDLFPQGEPFDKDPNKVRSAMFGLNYRLKEAEEIPFDVKDFMSRLEKTTGLLQAINRINNLEEFHQLILRVILPKVNPSLLKDKAKLRSAIAKAANASKQFASKGKYTI